MDQDKIDEMDLPTLVSALKLILRERHELISDEQLVAFFSTEEGEIELGKIRDASDQDLLEFFHNLQPENQAVLQNLCHLCHEVAKNSDVNLMTLENIVLALGPSIARVDHEPAKAIFARLLEFLPMEVEQ